MKQILLITNTNLTEHAGNVTLLERRAEALFAVGGYFTRMVVFRGVPQSSKPFQKSFYSVEYADEYAQLERLIKETAPEYVILYGRKVSLLIDFLRRTFKKLGQKSAILLDVQGCVEEKWEYAQSLKEKLIYPAHEIVFRFAINKVDGAFVVSDEMIDNCEKKRLGKRPIQYYKIRCGVNDLLSLEEKMAHRNAARQKYGIRDDAVVFVFSGFRKPWQKLDEIIADMKRFDASLEKTHFMLFCDTSPDFERQLAEAFPKGNYTVKLLGMDEYVQMLCACDVGYLMRDYNETNRVAFPNKFSEYLSCGLLIAMNGALPEPLRILKHNDVPYIDTDSDDLAKKVKQIREYAADIPQYYAKALYACRTELLYEEQIRKAGM